MTDDSTLLEYDVASVRQQFPALEGGDAHFDGPGGSQTPTPVARRIHDTLVLPLSNRGSMTQAQLRAERTVSEGRAAIADLLGVPANAVIFGRSTTQNNFDMSHAISKNWNPGDEVVVTRLDHDANVRPWVLAADAARATVRWVDFDPATGELEVEQVEASLSSRTRLVAVTAASNLIGTMPDIPAIAKAVHRQGAWLYVDGVHHSPHAVVDVPALDADFYTVSPYKFLGPHCGAVYGRPELLEDLEPDRLLHAADVIPEKFELGTLPFELLAGTAAAVDFLADLSPSSVTGSASRRERLVASMSAFRAHELKLRQQIEEFLYDLPGARVHSRARIRTSTLLVTIDGQDSATVSRRLAERGVNAPAGAFYAHEASRILGLGDAGGVRIGLAPYSDQTDLDRLFDALSSI